MKSSAFYDFSESAQDALDFARCQRPDGSFYGTGGQCRKGAPADAKEKKAPKGRKSSGRVSDADAAKLSKDLTRQIGEAGKAGDQKKADNLMQAKSAVDAQIKKRSEASLKRDDSKDLKNRKGQVIGTSPRNMLVDNIKTMEGRLKDSRSEAETKLLKDSIKKAKAKLAGEDKAAGKNARKEMIAARDAEKIAKEGRQKADRKVADAKADLSSAKSDLARKDLTSSERAQATTMKGQAERELKKQTAAAAEARRAHIESKKEMKAAAQRFRDGQTASNDMRRFGRQDERDKASIKQLQEAVKSGQLSPTKESAVRREISARQGRNRVRKDIKKLG